MVIDVSPWYTLAALLVVAGLTFSVKTFFDHLMQGLQQQEEDTGSSEILIDAVMADDLLQA